MLGVLRCIRFTRWDWACGTGSIPQSLTRRWCRQCLLRAGSAIGTSTSMQPGRCSSARRHGRIPSPVCDAGRSNSDGRSLGRGPMFRLNYGGIQYVDAPSLYQRQVGLRQSCATTAPLDGNHSETVGVQPIVHLVPGVNAQVVTGTVLLSIAGINSPGATTVRARCAVLRPAVGSRGQHQLPLWCDVALTSWSAGRDQHHHARQLRDHCRGTPASTCFRTGAATCAQDQLSIQFARAGGWTTNRDGRHRRRYLGVRRHRRRRLRHRPRAGAVWHPWSAAGNESEPWFDAENGSHDGKIFSPAGRAASACATARSPTVSAPDAAFFGIDPVRLPQRRAGADLPSRRGSPSSATPVASLPRSATAQTIDCARVRLSRVRARLGHNGLVIGARLRYRSEAGTVTFTDVTGYNQPVTIEHRIEDMAWCATCRSVARSASPARSRALSAGQVPARSLSWEFYLQCARGPVTCSPA